MRAPIGGSNIVLLNGGAVTSGRLQHSKQQINSSVEDFDIVQDELEDYVVRKMLGKLQRSNIRSCKNSIVLFAMKCGAA